MPVTVPMTLSPVFKVLMDCSRRASKFSSCTASTLIISLIVLLTSFIIHAGVDAPAVIPTSVQPAKNAPSSSDALSTRTVFSQASRQILNSLPVLELLVSPTTTMAWLTALSAAASFCRNSVALHIVSKIFKLVNSFFAIWTLFFHEFSVEVVWQTILTGKSLEIFSSIAHFSKSSAVSKIRHSRHQPAIPCTSG